MVFQQHSELYSVMTPKSHEQNMFMWGLGASSPFLGVERDTRMLWAAGQFKNELAWSQFEMFPILKKHLERRKSKEHSEQVLPSG